LAFPSAASGALIALVGAWCGARTERTNDHGQEEDGDPRAGAQTRRLILLALRERDVRTPTLGTLILAVDMFKFSRIPRGRYVTVLGIALAVVVVWSRTGAHEPHTWLVENALVPGLLLILFLSYRRLPLSRMSYTLIFAFLVLHEVGAHWTYSKVPYDEWWRVLFGTTLNDWIGLERNHFDRFVHFSYGLLFAYPIRELFLRVADVKGFWGYFLPLDVAMSTSTLFELVEWIAVILVNTDVGTAYLGTQGDIWDAQKDITCASLGALLAMCVTAAINARCKRDFARDFLQSLDVKHTKPLGEEGLTGQTSAF
jgi:putative membrane protein